MKATWQRIGGFRALVNPALDSPALREALAGIEALAAAPSATLLQAGRHRTIRLSLDCGDAPPLDAVAKFFGRQSPAKDLWDCLHATKARRTYEAALFLSAAGIGTTPPVACLERWRGPRLVCSVFVSAYVDDAFCFKDRLVALWRERAPYADFLAAMRVAAKGIRALHDAGCSHGDLGNQNIFLTRRTPAGPYEDALFLDLNRARFGSAPLSNNARARDLARICLPEGFLNVFMHLYWGGEPPRAFRRDWRRHYRRFRLHSATRKFRHPFRELRYVLHPETAPAQAPYPPAHRQWVWDADALRPAPVAREATLLSFLEPGYRRWLLANRPCPAARSESAPYHAHSSDGRASLVHRSAQRKGGCPDERAPSRVPLIRVSMADDDATVARRLAAARALAASGSGVALQILQVPDFLGGEPFAAFAERLLAACDFPLKWVCLGQGVNTLQWGLRDFAGRDALLAAAARLAADRRPGAPPVIPPAVEAPVRQAACANIPLLIDESAPYAGVALAWRQGDGDLAAEVRALREILDGASGNRSATKIFVISDSPIADIPCPDLVAEVAASKFREKA